MAGLHWEHWLEDWERPMIEVLAFESRVFVLVVILVVVVVAVVVVVVAKVGRSVVMVGP